jgi:transposase
MAPYSMDLRTRVVDAWDRGEDAETIAETFDVSRAWVHRLVQRRRDTGNLAPRAQTKFRPRLLADHDEQLREVVTAQPDRTLVEIQAALPTPASLTTIWRALQRLQLTVKKNGARRRTGPA